MGIRIDDFGCRGDTLSTKSLKPKTTKVRVAKVFAVVCGHCGIQLGVMNEACWDRIICLDCHECGVEP
jgi:hypothetical protein